MPTLALFVMGIDQVRDIFGATPDLAARLRSVAVERFAAPPPADRTLLGRLGPLFKNHPGTTVDPSRPSPADVDALLSGSFVDPARLSQAWQLLLAWLENLAVVHASIRVDDWDALEYDLARAGLHSEFALRNLASRDLGIPLRALPGQAVGYGKHQQLVDTQRALRDLLGHEEHALEPSTIRVIGELQDLLDRVPDGDPPLDLVVVQPPEDVPPPR